MYSTLAETLKHEVRRIARKEIKANAESIKRAVSQFRKDIAELKRTLRDVQRRLAALESEERKRLGEPPPAELAEGARFSAKWLISHRRKLGLTQADYAKLVGVSSLTIYNWEKEKTKPRKEQLAALVALRGLRKKETLRRLRMLESRN